MRGCRTSLFLLLLMVGCGRSTAPTDPALVALAAAEAKWESSGPRSYVYAVQRHCFCLLEYVGPARLRVEDGVVVEQVYVDSGAPVPADHDFPGVDALFDLLRSAYERGADEVTVTYDPASGVPVEAWIDYLEMAADEELGWLVTEDVSPLP